jgi:hypothetical protein
MEAFMTAGDPESLRARLVAIDDEMRQLPPDAFAQKYELLTEGDTHRKLLRELLVSDLDGASDSWSVRAGRKGAHSADDHAPVAQATIVSPGEGGASH